MPLGLFFTHEVPDEAERGIVVRAGGRRSLGTAESGLVEELLSPDLGGSFELLRSVFAPGAALQTVALQADGGSRLCRVGQLRPRGRRRLAPAWRRRQLPLQGKAVPLAESRHRAGGRHLGGFAAGLLNGSLTGYEHMAELPTTARVVIIGGGAVGVSSLYHLAKAGWTDCVLLEKNELTSGSTWHAAGNVPTFSSSWSLMNMQRYSAELYRGLAKAVDYPMNYHVTGSLRLAHTKERMREFQRVKGMGRYQGMDIDVVGPDEIRARYPFIETHDLKGALYDPNDGDIDPAQLTQALAKGARDMGAKIVRFCPVTGVAPRERRMDRRRRRKAKSAANMSSTPPAIAPARSARCSAATCR